MKAVIYLSKKNIKIMEVKVPFISNSEALIKVKWAGICGSDLGVYRGEFKQERVKPPLIMGHEFSGEIAKIDPESSRGLKVGDRVVVEPLLPCKKCYACKMGNYHICKNFKIMGIDAPGCFAEFIKVPIENIYKIPNNFTFDLAALVEPSAVAYHSVERSKLRAGYSVLVLGGGTIGILIAEMAKIWGASRIIISEIVPYRVNFAKDRLGFHVIKADEVDVLNEIKKITEGRGVDVVFDACGADAISPQIIDLCRIGGKIIITGLHKGFASLNFRELTFKEISLIGSRVYRYPDFEKTINLIENNKDRFSSIIVNRIELTDIVGEIERLNKGEGLKTLIKL